jgi:hypothetical protein
MDVTIDDVKAMEMIWGQSVLKMKGNTVRRNGKHLMQSIVKVPKELIKLQQDVELAIDCFFVNKHIFFTTLSTKTCFTTITHLTNVGVYIVMVCTMDRPYLSWTDHLLRLKWIQIIS